MGLHIHILRHRDHHYWSMAENGEEREREGLKRSKNNGEGRNLYWGEKQTKKRER